jgi:hypothetical protein
MTLTGLFASLDGTAAHLMAEVRAGALSDWPAYNAGVAAGLAGFSEDATEMFARRGSRQLNAASTRVAGLGHDPVALRTEVLALISTHRRALKLQTLCADPV